MTIDERRAWHYRAAGRTHGPHTWEELREFLAAGRIPADVKVSDDGESFIPLSDLDRHMIAPEEPGPDLPVRPPAKARSVPPTEPTSAPLLEPGRPRRRVRSLGILFLVTFLVMVIAGILQMRESASSSEGDDTAADQGSDVTEQPPSRLPTDTVESTLERESSPAGSPVRGESDPKPERLDPAAAMIWGTAVQAVRERMIRPSDAVFPAFGAEGTSVSIAAGGCTVRGYVDGVSESGNKSRVRWKCTLTELFDTWIATKTEVLE